MAWRALATVALALVISDLLKIVTAKGKWYPFGLGGMPSTHAAIVSALTAAVYFETGVSLLFAICLVFAILVVRDAFGVRWEVSRHSEALNGLLKKKAFFTRTGHTVAESVVGTLLGVAVGVAVYWRG